MRWYGVSCRTAQWRVRRAIYSLKGLPVARWLTEAEMNDFVFLKRHGGLTGFNKENKRGKLHSFFSHPLLSSFCCWHFFCFSTHAFNRHADGPYGSCCYPSPSPPAGQQSSFPLFLFPVIVNWVWKKLFGAFWRWNLLRRPSSNSCCPFNLKMRDEGERLLWIAHIFHE